MMKISVHNCLLRESQTSHDFSLNGTVIYRDLRGDLNLYEKVISVRHFLSFSPESKELLEASVFGRKSPTSEEWFGDAIWSELP